VTTNFKRSFQFYMDHFNVSLSNTVENPRKPGETIFGFLHIDKGEHYTEHRSFFLAEVPGAKEPRVHHAAFEVRDFDVQHVSHDYLMEKGHKPQWGIGRHGPGSQIFNYWYDRSGFVLEHFVLEHYCDGDIVNAETEFKAYKTNELKVWGPEFPREMAL
jgi:hypothetical protein